MVSVWTEFKEDIKAFIEGIVQGEEIDVDFNIENTISEPPDESLGDLSSNICFILAKNLSKPPSEIANMILDKSYDKFKSIQSVEFAPPGFLNFRIKKDFLIDRTFRKIVELDTRYGCWDYGKNKRVVLEHTSVNPNKPWHMGHARNAVLGDTMARIFRAVGYNTQVINYIDDLGRQVAVTLWGYFKYGNRYNQKFDHDLGRIYIDVNKDMSPEIEEEINKLLREIEKQDTDVARKVRAIVEKCVRSQLETAFKLDIDYDLLVWESDIVGARLLEETIQLLKDAGVLYHETEGERKGCWVFKTGQRDLDDKILIRSDATAVYTAKDIAFQLWKFGLLKNTMRIKKFFEQKDGKILYTTSSQGDEIEALPTEIVVNVIGAEQKYPQKIVYLALKALGYEKEYRNSYHLAYEHVILPEGKFSGRKGTWIGYDADTVIEEAIKKAYEEVSKRNPDKPEVFKREVARAVGIGAIRYTMLKTFPEKKITFRWRDVLDFNGETAPYIQYSHARACRILEKSVPGGPDIHLLEHEIELRLIKGLAKFPDIVLKSAREVKPHILANYAYKLASFFNEFYNELPVLKADESVRYARLALVDIYRITIRNALNLMGIEPVNQM